MKFFASMWHKAKRMGESVFARTITESIVYYDEGMNDHHAWLWKYKSSRVFSNGPDDRGSIPGRVIPKTQALYLMPPC